MKFQRRVLIVDDEEPARKTLCRLLAAQPDISVVAEAGSVVEAIERFHETRPDLVFLDVQMPKRDGFSLLPHLRPLPDIIFTTAYDCFAVKAFEVNAMDYLVKPIASERLELALDRLNRPPERKAKPFQRDDYVFLSADQELRVVLAKHITHIEGAGNYSKVHVADREPTMVRQRMKEWERLLPPSIFRKITRSALINLYAVREVLSLPHHHTLVRLSGSNETLELSRLASRALRKAVATIADS